MGEMKRKLFIIKLLAISLLLIIGLTNCMFLNTNYIKSKHAENTHNKINHTSHNNNNKVIQASHKKHNNKDHHNDKNDCNTICNLKEQRLAHRENLNYLILIETTEIILNTIIKNTNFVQEILQDIAKSSGFERLIC